MQILSSMKLEQECLDQGYDFVIGMDEAGRGPLAGPVVAAAACIKFKIQNSKFETISNLSDLIRDSKTLSEKQREKLYDFIHENFHVGVGVCDHETIDRINILEATYLAMKKALSALNSNIKKCHSYENLPVGRHVRNDKRQIILVDGNKVIPNLSIEQKAIVNGDKTVKSISAASIAAKVTRDRMMREYHEKYPQYSFDRHKGYGTAFHMERLKKYGPCEIHRRSFAPVRKWS